MRTGLTPSNASVLQRVAACCSVLQCVVACCSVKAYTNEEKPITSFNTSVLQCAAVCCSVLRYEGTRGLKKKA